MTDNRDCKHGRLVRKCETCELENEVAELNRQLDGMARMALNLWDSPQSLLYNMTAWANERLGKGVK